MNHDSLVLTVKMVRGDECSKAKKLCDSHSRLGEAVLAHLLTFVIRARQRLLELDDCLAPPAPPRRRRHAGGATWVDVRCGCERLRHDLKNPSTTVHAQSPCAASRSGLTLTCNSGFSVNSVNITTIGSLNNSSLTLSSLNNNKASWGLMRPQMTLFWLTSGQIWCFRRKLASQKGYHLPEDDGILLKNTSDFDFLRRQRRRRRFFALSLIHI